MRYRRPLLFGRISLRRSAFKAKSNLKSTHSGQFWKPTKNQFFSRGTMAKLKLVIVDATAAPVLYIVGQ